MTATSKRLRRARTLLFVPGNRPDRFAKALASGADGVILDLEDAVPDADKAAAREHAAARVEDDDVVVRVNDPSSPWFHADLEMLSGRRARVMLAKTESAEQVATVLGALAAGSVVVPLVETAAGVLAAPSICAAPGVARAALGAVDLATELGLGDPGSPTLAWCSAMLVNASVAAGIAAPLASPSLRFDDPALVREECRAARGLGFGGKLCIHPDQVAPAHDAFAPTADEVRWARAVLTAEADGSATRLDGQMLDRPLFERARRILASAPPTAAPADSQKEMP